MDTQVASNSHTTAANPAPATAIRGKYLLLSLLIASRWVVYGFTDVALTAVLRKSGVSLAQISLMLGVGFLFMFKFLWAPLVDRMWLREKPIATGTGPVALGAREGENAGFQPAAGGGGAGARGDPF